MTGRPTVVPATAKGEATRRYLLRTAAGVFAERGYAATTLAELIAASGLTKGAFYFYFRSKAELALAVLADQQARWLDLVRREVLALPGAAAQLRALVPALLDLIESEPAVRSITRLTQDLAADPVAAQEVRASTGAWVALVAGIVRRGQAAGEVRAGVDPDDVAAVLVGAFDGVKALTDVLEQGDAGAAANALRARAGALLALVDAALLQ